MISHQIFHQKFQVQGGDFVKAGESSCEIRRILKEIGIDADTIRRVAIAAYEAEMNVVMYAHHGTIHFSVSPGEITIIVDDRGQGIPDIERALQPGYSTATRELREMGFGAGMGLPNIKKNADIFTITSTVGTGTELRIVVKLNGDQ